MTLGRPRVDWCLALVATLASGAERFYVTPAGATLVESGLAAPAPLNAAAAGFQPVARPGVRNEARVAGATGVPWVESNGWRYQRGLRRANYEQLPAGAAELAAAEAFAFNAEAILNPDPSDVPVLGALLRFLKAQDESPLPVLANIGIVDDGSPATGEILNLFTRRNLLYRVVTAPEQQLNLNVRIGSAEFPRASVANPYEFAARVRSMLGDDKRLVRIYGSNTVLVHLTGDGRRARLFLLNYSRRAVPQTVRVRLAGAYRPVKFTAPGSPPDSKLLDVAQVRGAIEFSVPPFTTLGLIDLAAKP